MQQDEKSLEDIFAEVTASAEELEQTNGGADYTRVLATERLTANASKANVLKATGAVRLDERALADLSAYFNRGLSALEGGLAFRPDRDVGH